MSKNNFRPEYQAKLPKTDHDLSHSVKFSSSVGHILPVFHHLVNPGENLKVDIKLFTRTQPLVTAAMVDLDEKVDFFFVPFPMLYTAFEPKLYGTTDYLSSWFAMNESQGNEFPIVNFRKVDGTDEHYDFDNYWSSFTNHYDKGRVCGIYSASRLFAHLHYNYKVPFNGAAYDVPDPEDPESTITLYDRNNYMPSIFPYALLSYHAIYYNYFCMQDFETKVVNFWNWDYQGNDSFGCNNLPKDFFCLHYVPYGADYFTHSYGTPLLSGQNMSVNQLSMSGKLLESMRLYLGNSTSVFASDENGVADSSYDVFSQVSSNGASDLVLATNQLRANFAIEKYLRVLGRADKTYDAQVLAHFGYNVPTDIKHQIQHIGHFGQEIKIGEVVSTAQTYTGDAGASLGEIAGKGYGMGERNRMVDFTAPCHGVVMAVFYCKPKQVYNNYGFDRINWFTGVESLFNPEFDNLGPQPIFHSEIIDPLSQKGLNVDSIVAWTDRYHEYKHKYSWASPAFAEPFNDVENPDVRQFNNWDSWINGQCPLRVRDEDAFVIDPEDTLVNRLVHPSDLNQIFTVDFVSQYNENYVTKPWLIYQGDPFMHDLTFHATLWSTMSKTGESSLGDI